MYASDLYRHSLCHFLDNPFNISFQTTLAMSTMWALTGSMDARLVADGRAADVAYDNGVGPKRTAVVTVTGYVNKEPFTVTRRRGKGGKLTELKFHLGGKDMTTQSVKDTQDVIDKTLGIGGGLLQRCTFFGQHSSTLQASPILILILILNAFDNIVLILHDLYILLLSNVRHYWVSLTAN